MGALRLTISRQEQPPCKKSTRPKNASIRTGTGSNKEKNALFRPIGLNRPAHYASALVSVAAATRFGYIAQDRFPLSGCRYSPHPLILPNLLRQALVYNVFYVIRPWLYVSVQNSTMDSDNCRSFLVQISSHAPKQTAFLDPCCQSVSRFGPRMTGLLSIR